MGSYSAMTKDWELQLKRRNSLWESSFCLVKPGHDRSEDHL